MPPSNEDSDAPRTILLVEDNPGDARLVKEMWDEMGLTDALRVVSTGSDALDFVNQRGEYDDAPRPDLIILDWHLTDVRSEDVLAELNGDPAHGHVPLLVTTGSLSARELREAYAMNANACLEKPAGPDELEEIIRSFESFWLSTARLPTVEDGTQ